MTTTLALIIALGLAAGTWILARMAPQHRRRIAAVGFVLGLAFCGLLLWSALTTGSYALEPMRSFGERIVLVVAAALAVCAPLAACRVS